MYRRKLQGKLKESDESLNELQAKYSSLDKAKNHIAAELEDLNLDLEKAREHQKAIPLLAINESGLLFSAGAQ